MVLYQGPREDTILLHKHSRFLNAKKKGRRESSGDGFAGRTTDGMSCGGVSCDGLVRDGSLCSTEERGDGMPCG